MTEPVEPAAPLLTPDDLKNFATIAPAKAQEMIDDAIGEAAFHAPCTWNGDFFPAHLRGFVKSKLRGAVLRWNEAGTGAVTLRRSTMSYGQTIDTRQPRKGMFFQAEIDQLKAAMPQRRRGRRVRDRPCSRRPRLGCLRMNCSSATSTPPGDSARRRASTPVSRPVTPRRRLSRHGRHACAAKKTNGSLVERRGPGARRGIRRCGPACPHDCPMSKRAEYTFALYSGSLAEPGDRNPYAGGSLVLAKLWMSGYRCRFSRAVSFSHPRCRLSVIVDIG